MIIHSGVAEVADRELQTVQAPSLLSILLAQSGGAVPGLLSDLVAQSLAVSSAREALAHLDRERAEPAQRVKSAECQTGRRQTPAPFSMKG